MSWAIVAAAIVLMHRDAILLAASTQIPSRDAAAMADGPSRSTAWPKAWRGSAGGQIVLLGRSLTFAPWPLPTHAGSYVLGSAMMAASAVVLPLLLLALVTAMTIRHRRRLERLLDERTRTLQQSEQRLLTTLHSIGDGVISADLEGAIEAINPVAESLTGWSRAQALGRPLGEVLRLAEESSREPTSSPTPPAMAERIIGDPAANLILIDAMGGEHPVSQTVSSIRNEAGEVTGCVVVFRDVSEERARRAALRESELRLRTLIDTLPDLVWLKDANGVYLSCNRRFEQFFGATEKEIAGKTDFDFVSREMAVMFRRNDLAAMSAGGPVSNEERIRFADDGHYEILETIKTPIFSVDGELRGVLGIGRDITARKNAESALRESEERHRQLFEAASDAFIVFDLRGEIVDVNPSACQMYGYEEDAFIGLGGRDIIHPRCHELFEQYLQDAARTGSFAAESLDVRKDGEAFSTEVKGSRVTFNGHTRLLAVVRDVTERKRLAEEGERAREALDTIVESMPVGIAIVGRDRMVRKVNQAALSMFGAESDEEVVGRRCHETICTAGSHACPFLDLNVRLDSAECLLRTSDGGNVPILKTVVPIEINGEGVLLEAFIDISERKRMEQKLVADARTDGLTGLANRIVLGQRLEDVLRKAEKDPERCFAVLFLDFDRFKNVNDSMGHDVGDDLLRQIAQRLTESMRPSNTAARPGQCDTIARFGGDEFVVLLDELDSAEDAAWFADHILATLSEPYRLSGHDVFSTASIGLVFQRGPGAATPAELIRDADTAMYEAKMAGKGCHRMFDDSMRQRVQRRHHLESDLRAALIRDELFLEYQPIVNLHTGELESAEALARWRHPAHGLVSPGEFIPIAEDTGLILEIGEWTLRKACEQLMEWRCADDDLLPLAVSVNLSRKQFALAGLPNMVGRILAETGMDPSRLHLEITESTVMDDVEHAVRVLGKIKAQGVQIVMDDFGTGYSSLACLQQLPFDVLKIDRTFVAGLDANRDLMAMIHAVATLSSNLGIHIVVEGIETASQLATLQSLDFASGQGFLFSRPVPPERIREAHDRVAELRAFRDAA